MKDMIGNSISDDAEFDDLEDFDYVDQFGGQDDDDDDSDYADDTLDDLDDLYVDEDEEDDGFEDEDHEGEESDRDKFEDEESGDAGDELEVKLSCDECGHKWMDLVSETEEENELYDVTCPMCGTSNVSIER